MARKKRRKKGSHALGWVTAAVASVIVFSLVVRWAGHGSNAWIGRESFQIEVLNGTGEKGLAMKTAMALREMGIDVLIIGDAERYDFTESILVDRKGNPALMKKLARLLGCRRVLKQVQQSPLVDATLIIGRDKDELNIKLSDGS